MTHQPVSDLVADHAEHQESRQEGVEEEKVQCVSGQSSGITLVDDLVAVGDQTGPGEITCNIWKNSNMREKPSVSAWTQMENHINDKRT